METIQVQNTNCTDTEALLNDADGNQVWAVIKCEPMEIDMARSLAGNLRGRASWGKDELEENPTPYAERLKIATDKLSEIIGDKQNYLRWMMGCLTDPNRNMLEEAESIVEQCEAWELGKSPRTIAEYAALPAKKVYSTLPDNCSHLKETGCKSGIMCRECGRVRQPDTQFEKQLIARFNPRGSGYVNYK